MQLLKFVPIKLTLFLVFGILFGFYFNIPFICIAVITLICLVFLGWIFVKQKSANATLFGAIAVCTTICIGALAVALHNPKNALNHYSKFPNTGTNKLHIKITEVLKSNTFSQRYYAEILSLNNIKTQGKIALIIPNDSTQTNVTIDQELLLYGEISEINAPLNPHEFDYKKYLESLGIYHQIYAKPNELIRLEKHNTTIYGIVADFRNTIIAHLREANFANDELGVIQALLLGERNDISEETYTNYKNAGAIHILAVSGLHIGILLLLLQFLLQPLENITYGKKIKLVLIVFLLWGFAFLAGLSASVVRAVTMFTFLAYAESLNRPANKFNVLALSMFFILLFKPSYLFHVGFQMSYLAVFAILWIYPMLQRFWFPKNKIIRYIWQLLSVSIAAQLGVLPLSLFYFHQFPGLFFITNLAVIPFLGFILVFGIIVIILALFNMLPKFIASIYNDVIQFMNDIIGWIAQQESFLFKSISFDSTMLVLSYFTIIFLVLALSKPTFKRVTIFLGGIIAFQIWLLIINYNTTRKQEIMVLHQSRNTGLLYQNGETLHLYSINPNRLEKTVDVYATAEFTKTNLIHALKNNYDINHKQFYVMDSFAIHPPTEANISHILLTQSPKINLERLLDSMKPEIILADGSNYKSDVLYWKETCKKRKLPFHYTGEKGAYYFNLND